MRDNLIICPVGMPMPFDDRWNKNEHWRFTLDKRQYETLVVVYNDFEPEIGSYDHIIRKKGHKWPLIREVCKEFDTSRYKYVGCVDDDLITDIDSFNLGLQLAHKFDFRFWQLSMPNDSSLIYECLKHKPGVLFSETNFIEMGSCFFRQDKFKMLLELLTEWETLQIGWGIDKVFCDYLQDTANVVHAAQIHQPYRDSYYDKSFAMQEMNDFLYHLYPKILHDKHGRKSGFVDRQVTLKEWRFTKNE
jgi:hypothetical protein